MKGKCWHGIRVATAVLSTLLLSCIGGFFPPTGIPDTSGVLRSTAAGLVEQLMLSYQTKQLSVFRDILDEASFRFYISPSILNDLSSVDKNRHEDIAPDFLVFVPGNTYTYLTAQDEIAIHRAMFAHADTLQFITKPVVDSIYYEREFTRYDTLVLPDTLFRSDCMVNPSCPESLFTLHDTVVVRDTVIRAVYDTTAATLLLWPSQIKIAAGEVAQEYGSATNIFEVGAQVFYARRQPDKLWKLVKWFELDN